ncbi:MAG: hypothetical protein HQK75_14350 [Candidatus Magnetomorum sp.]|nr:hypothetical protein [Candidatus Magnetomorum sp.]
MACNTKYFNTAGPVNQDDYNDYDCLYINVDSAQAERENISRATYDP